MLIRVLYDQGFTSDITFITSDTRLVFLISTFAMAEQQPLLGSGGSTDASSDRAAVGAIDAAKRKKKEKSIMKSSLDIVFSCKQVVLFR